MAQKGREVLSRLMMRFMREVEAEQSLVTAESRCFH